MSVYVIVNELEINEPVKWEIGQFLCRHINSQIVYHLENGQPNLNTITFALHRTRIATNETNNFINILRKHLSK